MQSTPTYTYTKRMLNIEHPPSPLPGHFNFVLRSHPTSNHDFMILFTKPENATTTYVFSRHPFKLTKKIILKIAEVSLYTVQRNKT